MNLLFRRLPLPLKLLMVALVPLLYILFLTLQVYQEKTQKISMLEGYMVRMRQSSNITFLIDELQKERRYSYEFALEKRSQGQMIAQRPRSDSQIQNLTRDHDLSLTNFIHYTFLEQLDSVRRRIDSGTMAANGVMHYFSSTIFRLNTLNGEPMSNNSYLEGAYRDMSSQKLLSEMITYLGIMNANVYNVLLTRQYIIETLMGTLGTHDVYGSYKKEFLIKANAEARATFVKLQKEGSLQPVDAYLNKLFSTFKFDSSYSAQSWAAASDKAINDLRNLQMKLLGSAQADVQSIYSREEKAKNRSLFLLILALFLVIAIVSYTVFIINSMLKELKVAALKIARGESGLQLENVSNDAIGSLAESILQIDRTNKALAQAAQSIGKGNFNVSLEPRSEQDVLTNALVMMKEDLITSTARLEQSKEQFRQLADSMPQIVWTAGPDGNIEYFNDQYYAYTGLTRNNVEGPDSVIFPDDLEKIRTAWQASVKSGNPYTIEYRIRNRKGEFKWFLVRALPVKDQHGKVVKWFGTCTEIHESKTASEALEMLVQERTEALQRSNEDLQQFAHVASHDLKEPLRKIIMYGGLLETDEDNKLSEKGESYLQKIQTAATRMTSMVEGVLNFSSVSAEPTQFEVVDLNEILKNVMVDLEVVLQKKGARIHSGILPRVKGIEILLNQLFYNLINNALKFSKQNIAPEIHVTCTKKNSTQLPPFFASQVSNEFYEIEVSDNGIGFDPAYAEMLFDSFTRLHPKEKYEGTGLGLALCKKIVMRHHGFITAEGRENAGASFRIYLPVLPLK